MKNSARSVRIATAMAFAFMGWIPWTAAQDDAKSIEITTEVPGEKMESNEPTSLDHGASINPKLLAVVNDSATGIQPEERDVYFRSLKLAQETSQLDLQQAASKILEHRRAKNPQYAHEKLENFPQFRDLVQNPQDYRGQVVSLRGTIRRLTKYEPGENKQGIKEVYEGWLYTADSNSNPTVVVFTSKPPQLNLGPDITDEIRATGYFFKMYNYESQGGPSSAPMLLAGTVEWHPPPNNFVFQPLSGVTYAVIIVLLLIVLIAMRSTSRPRRIPRFDPNAPIDLSQLEQR